MQQPPPPMMNMMPPFPPTNITTEQIQKYLDENKKLIMAILDNQNLGKLAECAQYQVQLQKNLMYLAAIADAQPQAPTMPPQMPPHPAMQQGGHYMQHPQAAAMAQQSIGFPPKMPPVQFNPQQIQEQQQQLQQQQAIQAHMGMRSGVNNGRHAMHTETTLGGGGSGGPPSTAAPTEFSRGGGGTSSTSLDARGSKQDGMEGGSGDGQGNSAAGPNSGNGEPSYLKGSEEAK